MSGTKSTGFLKSLAQGLAGAVMPDFQVVSADSESFGDNLGGSAFQIQFTNQLGIFLLQRGNKLIEAVAELLHFGIRHSDLISFHD